jgi:ADP-ribose pyrophosphatase YjhB (NUDIX family)
MKGMLDAFGGFVDGTETIEEALRREIKEELGLDPTDYTTPIYLTSASSGYDFQGETRTVLSSLFYAYLLPGAEPRAADDVAGIHSAKIEDVSVEDIGNQDIRVGLVALRERLAGTS